MPASPAQARCLRSIKMLILHWPQVTAWRLAQHSLLQRDSRDAMLDVVARLGGLQAQLMSAAELQLWARVDGITPAQVEQALWHDRTLVKSWAMRGTLHLMRATDLPRFVAARQVSLPKRPPSWYNYHAVTPEEETAILDGVRAILGDTGITREALADAVAERVGNPKLRELLLSGWGALLKPSAYGGDLCFGPNQGQQVTFVRPADWLGTWTELDPEASLQTIARRFLATYGPATSDEFGRWWGMDASRARKLFKALGDEISEVSVEGWRAWALISTLEAMQSATAAPSVRLLPFFDPYTIAVARHSQVLLDDAHKGRVYRAQGWISPVVLVDGRLAGVWEMDKQRARTILAIELFASPTAEIKAGIEAEAARLGPFLESEVEIRWQ
jgi:hypothetical protein